MNRYEFLSTLSIVTFFGILGCGVQPKFNDQIMSAKGESKATATVTYKVIDADGNVKETGTLTNKE